MRNNKIIKSNRILKILKRMSCITLSSLMAGFTVFSCGMPLKVGQAASTAWTKVDNVFVNSLGNEIEGAILKGIDVSYHNKDIDWEQVKNSDIDYAIIRCGYGQDYENQDDVKWEEYANACMELNIPFGTYLYSYATTVSAAKSEAEHVLRVIEGYPLTYPVYYDMEDSKQAGTTAQRKAQMAEVFCSIIEEAGYQVGIYANTDWFTNKLTDPYFDTRDKWVAQYNAVCKYTGNYRMWQCTSSGQVPGISTKVDLNFWYDQPPAYQGNTPQGNAGNLGTPGNSSTAQPGEIVTPGNTNSTGDPNAGNNSNLGDNQIIDNNTSIGNQGSESNGNTNNTGNPGENQIPGNQPDSENNETPGGNTNPSESSGTQNNDSSNSQGTEVTPSPDNTTEPNDSDQNNDNKDNSNNGDKIETVDKEDNLPEKLTISQDTLLLSYGGTSVLTANQSVKWSSSDKTVVKIGSKGKVTPVGVGEAVITATTSSGETAECKVTIKKPIKDTEIEEIPSQQFTGSQICPEPIVMDDDKVLEKGTDYKVSYMDNMGKGTAIITIEGKGYYTGDVDVNFQIIPKKKLAVPVVNSISSKKNVVTLKWKKISKASGYEIYRTTTKGGIYTLQKTCLKKSKVTYKDKKLTKGKKYYYKIRAYKVVDNKKQYSKYAKVNIKV